MGPFQGVGALLPLCGDNTGKVMIIEITFMVLALPAVKGVLPVSNRIQSFVRCMVMMQLLEQSRSWEYLKLL